MRNTILVETSESLTKKPKTLGEYIFKGGIEDKIFKEREPEFDRESFRDYDSYYVFGYEPFLSNNQKIMVAVFSNKGPPFKCECIGFDTGSSGIYYFINKHWEDEEITGLEARQKMDALKKELSKGDRWLVCSKND